MKPNPNSQSPSIQIPTPPKCSFWQKVGGGSLSISLVLHVILLAIGVIWVLQVIPADQEKVIEFLGKSGGGSPTSESQAKKQQAQMMRPNLTRVSALESVSSIVLPDPESSPAMTSLGSISPGGISGGIGGKGTGGGKGDGNGLGIGSGIAPGLSNGNATKNPFGIPDLTTDALVGTFYDFKQTSDRKPTNMTDDEMRQELRDIVKRGFKERSFEKYFKAPAKLYQTKLRIPTMSADAAPAAFDVQKEVQPKRWVVVYRGAVKAPKSGKFRFVGAGDDVMVVRFNGRMVFDYGYTLACSDGRGGMMAEENYNKDRTSDFVRNFKRSSPMPVPTTTYRYTTTDTLNKDIGGLAVGAEFQVTEGSTCPIEILISEIPGGLFSAALLIQEEGVNYDKDPAGYPIVPLFRLDNSLPDPAMKGQAPPFDATGPVWKSVEGAAKRDI